LIKACRLNKGIAEVLSVNDMKKSLYLLKNNCLKLMQIADLFF